MDRPVVAVLATTGVYALASGYIHVREWLETYRHIPRSVPGSAVVRVGFPLSSVVSLLAVLGLAYASVGRPLRRIVVVGVVASELAPAAAVVISRHGGLLGWMESGWTGGAAQSLTVELAAALFGVLGLVLMTIRRPDPAGSGRHDP